MDSYESSEARFADIRAAREQRKARRPPPAGPDKARDSYDTPPYDNFPMEDTAPAAKGSLVRVVVTQAAVCALLLGCLVGVRKMMPNTYRQLRAAYTQAMRTDMSVKEVWAAAKAVFASLKEDIYVMVPYREASGAQAAAGAGGIDIALEYASQNCSAAPIATTARPFPPLGEGALSSAFGYRIHPISGEEGVHAGMDVAAPEGDPVSAAFFGTVLEAGESKGYGKYVLMEHAGGLQTLYAHCSEIAAGEGMVLRPGDVIAYVGSTGNSTGPHLHFEVRLHGLRCDPAPLFGSGMYPPKEEEPV
ncbi:MAG: M23 family metallopeptidase [Oscillospiraceae bacterium]|jgi:murein DD-endopeptidase MepM/ murein hydrolase activator NlpD|nr:M23 family metallopeptidase [Oscillospiraceae bacterium]